MEKSLAGLSIAKTTHAAADHEVEDSIKAENASTVSCGSSSSEMGNSTGMASRDAPERGDKDEEEVAPLPLALPLHNSSRQTYSSAGGTMPWTYGCAQLVPANLVYPTFMDSEFRLLATVAPSKVQVVVCSDKPLKLLIVENLFRCNNRFKNSMISFMAVKSNSGIAEQPIGITSGRLGASNRLSSARDCLETSTKLGDDAAVYYCAVENFFETEGFLAPRDHAYVIVRDHHGNCYHAVSVGVHIHPNAFAASLADSSQSTTGYSTTVGSFFHKCYGFDSSDWFSDVLGVDNFDRKSQIQSTLDNGDWF